MGRLVTSGQICMLPVKVKAKQTQTLSIYIKKKVKFLEQFCIYVPTEFFLGCGSEIAVDNRARDIILSR